jgi:hypothetical protein
MFFGMPFDILALIVVFAILFSWLLYFGKSSGVSLFFALFAAYTFELLSPLQSFITEKLHYEKQSDTIALIIFLITTLLLFFIFRRLVSTVFSWSPMRRVFEAILLALSIIGFLLLAITPHMEISFLTQYGKIISMFLAIPHILFYWILGSFAMLFLTSGRS